MGKYDWLDSYLLSNPGAEKAYKAEWGWDRYIVAGKMFAAVCRPDLKYGVYGGHELLTVKCEPLVGEMTCREYPDILPGFYMDKRHWISVFLDGDVPDDVLRGLCAASYRLVLEKLAKKVQKELTERA